MLSIILGNIFSFIGCVLIIIETQAKTYKKTMMLQALDATSFTISGIFLRGWSGVIANAIAAIRAIFCYKGELKRTTKILFIIITIIITFIFRDREWYGILPILAATTYSTVALNTSNIKAIKIALIINNLLWGLYALLILNYVNAIFSPIAALSSFISLIKLNSEDK